MTGNQGPNVGTRIRALREQRGYSLRKLAEICGLSVNAISRIEHGENSPTVSSLHRLATALNVTITDFFQEEAAHSTVHVRKDRRLVTTREGIIMESLGIGLRNQQLEPFILTIEAGTSSLEEEITHAGQEFVYCMRGVVDYHVGDTVYPLERGDSVLFEATQPHGFSNSTDEEAVLLIVFQVGKGTPPAWKQHFE